MKGFKINTNKEYVSKIIEGIIKKDGHCPCRVNSDDSTLCPCNEFVNDGICKCNLFLKINDKKSK